MTDFENEPDVERRYVDAVLAGDFMSAIQWFERLRHEERPGNLARNLDPAIARRVRLRHRAGFLDRVMSSSPEGRKGAWLVEADGLPLVCAFDEWIILNPARLSVARSFAERLGLLDP